MTELIPTQWQSNIERLRDNINNVFERYLTKFKRAKDDDEGAWTPALFDYAANAIELDDDDDRLIAHLALPGLSQSDIKVEVTQDRLVIRGAKKQARKKANRNGSRFEESQAAFAQAIALPCEIERDRVTAKYKNGLLTVILPKREDARSKRLKIPIKA